MTKVNFKLRNVAILFACLAATTMLAVTLNSCDKDDVQEMAPTPESLNGTTWEGTVTDKGTTLALTLTFSQSTCSFMMAAAGSSDALSFTYNYEYVKPLLTMISTQGGDDLSGAVDGSRMTLRMGTLTPVLTRKQ
jgi:hypothetical protein